MKEEKVGKLIKDIRKKNNLTQKQFADIYHVTYQAVSKWENNISIPDITLLKKICKDNNITLDEAFDVDDTKNKVIKNKYIYIFLIFVFIFIFIIFFVLKKENDFKLKTINSKCDNFNISGSLAYNKNKSSIYISDINYCGQEDKKLYKKIECIIYEKKNIIKKYESNGKIMLDDFLNDFELKIDDYKYKCKDLTNNLSLKINAYIDDNNIITYKIPLVLNDKCLLE